MKEIIKNADVDIVAKIYNGFDDGKKCKITLTPDELEYLKEFNARIDYEDEMKASNNQNLSKNCNIVIKGDIMCYDDDYNLIYYCDESDNQYWWHYDNGRCVKFTGDVFGMIEADFIYDSYGNLLYLADRYTGKLWSYYYDVCFDYSDKRPVFPRTVVCDGNGIYNHRPITYNRQFESFDFELFTSLQLEDQLICKKWVDDRYVKSVRANKDTSDVMKHILERDTGIFMTDNQFKDFMMSFGYDPVNCNELQWKFRVKLKK